MARMRDAKMVIYEGACQAVARACQSVGPGVLVDEEFGADVARRARADGFILAMPIERSGTKLFELEYGDEYVEHVDTFDPDFFKVLIRFNPDDEAATRNTQIQRLATVSAWATASGRRWLVELLVPGTRKQFARRARIN